MLAKTFGIECSKRCERLLAFAYLEGRDKVKKIAYCVSNDCELSAVRLAERLSSLPEAKAVELSEDTLRMQGPKAREKTDGGE